MQHKRQWGLGVMWIHSALTFTMAESHTVAGWWQKVDKYLRCHSMWVTFALQPWRDHLCLSWYCNASDLHFRLKNFFSSYWNLFKPYLLITGHFQMSPIYHTDCTECKCHYWRVHTHRAGPRWAGRQTHCTSAHTSLALLTAFPPENIFYRILKHQVHVLQQTLGKHTNGSFWCKAKWHLRTYEKGFPTLYCLL